MGPSDRQNMDHIPHKKAQGYDVRRLTMRDILGPLFRNWIVVTVTFCLLFAGALVAALTWARHYYVADMQIVVERERSNPTVTSGQNTAPDNTTAVTADEVASEIALLQGHDMLQQVAQTCQLDKSRSSVSRLFGGTGPSASVTDDARALEIATQGLAAKLRVQEERTSHLIDVSYGRTGAPEIPACVLQALGQLYLEKHLRLQRPAGAFNFFAQQTDEYQRALADSEARLADFSKAEGEAAPDVLRTSMAQELVASQSNLYQARQMVATYQRRIEELQTQIGDTPERSSTQETSLSANTLLEQLQSSLLTSQLKETQLLMKYDASYPLVKEVETEIDQTRQAIAEADTEKYVNTSTDRDPTYEFLRQDLAKTRADLAAEQATATALVGTVQGMRAELVNFDQQSVQEAALVRDVKTNEDNYLLYLTKREQERASDALDQKRIANVAIAVPAQVPVLPAHSASSVAIAGFWLALLAATGAGYLVEAANQSFRTPAEVEELLNISVLAAVPKQAA